MSGMPVRRVLGRCAVAIAATTLIASCAQQVPYGVEPEAPGFWLGLVQGVILPFAWFGSLFSDSIAIYSVPNNGGWYDFGFVLGVTCLGGGASAR
jgi:hypothetical protein